MAKKGAATEEPTTALATVTNTNQALAISDKAKAGDTRGTEGIESTDVRLPFLAIAQKTSKALDKSESKYIKDLEFLDMYNSETGDILGQGPIEFIPIVLRKRAHLLKENGTLGEPVKWDDPRVTWEGAREAGLDKPEGQQIYDWAILLVPTMTLLIVSFRSTSFGAGKSLNGFVRMRKPSFAGKYNISVAQDKNDAGSFGKFMVTPAGKPTDDQFDYAEVVYESIKDKVISADEPDPNDAGDAPAPATVEAGM